MAKDSRIAYTDVSKAREQDAEAFAYGLRSYGEAHLKHTERKGITPGMALVVQCSMYRRVRYKSNAGAVAEERLPRGDTNDIFYHGDDEFVRFRLNLASFDAETYQGTEDLGAPNRPEHLKSNSRTLHLYL